MSRKDDPLRPKGEAGEFLWITAMVTGTRFPFSDDVEIELGNGDRIRLSKDDLVSICMRSEALPV